MPQTIADTVNAVPSMKLWNFNLGFKKMPRSYILFDDNNRPLDIDDRQVELKIERNTKLSNA